MKLKWEVSRTALSNVLPEWAADGASYSYLIRHLPIASKYQVLKLRQPAGQIVAETFSLTLEGAHARAQTWEDGK